METKSNWEGKRGLDVKVVEGDYLPPCPHCRVPLTLILKRLSSGFNQSDAIYSCGACGELLSIGLGVR